MKPSARKKPPRCKICTEQFFQTNTTQVVCSVQCAMKYAELKREKDAERNRKKQVVDTRNRKQALKTKSQHLADAQVEFNKYIRYVDRDEPCISCGRYDHEIPDSFVGGKWDCGHYLTRGAYPELRFHPMNAHKQCKGCNGGSGRFVKKNRTVTGQYRINLIVKIGLGNVEWLEGEQIIQHLSIEDINDIKIFYREQLKVLKNEQKIISRS